MNPYDFVRIDWERPPERRPAISHDRFEGLSGRLEAKLTALRPIFLPADAETNRRSREEAKQFSQSPAYRNHTPEGYFIPGSSLKGLCRSVVETIAPGCIWFCALPDNVPSDFKPCQRADSLCPACRLFGLIKGNTLRAGNVSFSDAICSNAEPHEAIFTTILSSPKSYHRAFYLNGKEHIAGRKYYFHYRRDNLLTAHGWLPAGAAMNQRQNQYLRPLGEGTTFTFSASFFNLAEDDLSALLYALTLETDMRHKFGYAKPCGLGSVQIELTKLVLRNPIARYRGGNREEHYQENKLCSYLEQYAAPFAHTISPNTREDLKRIWKWEPPEDVIYQYPSRSWFDQNPDAPIAETP